VSCREQRYGSRSAGSAQCRIQHGRSRRGLFERDGTCSAMLCLSGRRCPDRSPGVDQHVSSGRARAPAYKRSRVTPGWSSTMERSAVRRLTVLLPTFGRRHRHDGREPLDPLAVALAMRAASFSRHTLLTARVRGDCTLLGLRPVGITLTQSSRNTLRSNICSIPRRDPGQLLDAFPAVADHDAFVAGLLDDSGCDAQQLGLLFEAVTTPHRVALPSACASTRARAPAHSRKSVEVCR